MGTRTGNFPIGFRQGWTEWFKKDFGKLCGWAAEQGFEVIDVPGCTADDLAILKDHKLQLGTADLLEFGNLCHTEEAKRKEAVAKNVERIKVLGKAGVKKFFGVVLPSDHAKPRAENYDLAVKSFSEMAAAAAKAGAAILLEGWPGGRPHYSSLCCTPETYRRIFQDIPKGLGVNYDPSHLIRLGVDHIRFAEEFIDKIGHVHAKDTELFPEAIYEFGLQQPPTFVKGHGFGEATWRYTLPGHGVARWSKLFEILAANKYKGAVCIELEDEKFNGSEAGEKLGLTSSLAFLKSA